MEHPKLPQTIEEVIAELDQIIYTTENENSPLGYFAALYRKVTIKVKEGIASNFFDDGPRMERLDVIFANRYLESYYLWENKEEVTKSWNVAFTETDNYWPTVLQHLLIGMNAHINLDLGVAASQVMKGADIDDLKGDFDKINEVLSALVNEVQEELASIWPMLKRILKVTKKVDDFLVDFSMELARNGAWKFAKELSDIPVGEVEAFIEKRDTKVASNTKLVFSQNIFAKLIFGIIRVGERGSIQEKIEKLAN